jgi:uncharacterized protein involved in exopolysaccharide biosynthesis
MPGEERTGRLSRPEELRPVYVAVAERADDAIDIPALWRTLWEGRWLVTGVSAVFAIVSIAYALLATPIYRVEVLLASTAEDRLNTTSSGLGSLVSLAGINLGRSGDSMEAIATLQSRQFAEEFIRDKELMPLLFPDKWDARQRRWLGPEEDHPDMRDAVRVFTREIRRVEEDSKTGLVTLTIDWTDPEQAAEWAMEIVARLNARMRTRDLEEAERKLAYLQEQLKSTSLLEVREAIARVVEDQINAMMLAQAQHEYAFRVIDPAVPPKERSWPKRTLIVVASTVFGGFIGVFLVLMRASRKTP